MVVQIIKGTDRRFASKARKVFDMYNEFTNNREELTIKAPERLLLARVMGVPGGVVVDRYGDDLDIGAVMCAAFGKDHQRKGNLTACLNALNSHEKGLSIRVIQLNPFDDRTVWERFGYTHEGFINMTSCALNASMEEVFPDETINEGLQLDEAFFKMFGGRLFQ